MNQVLSQDEIDALLKGISDGEVETEKEVLPPPPEVEAQTYDFIKVIKAKKEKLPALQFVYDRFSKDFASALSLFMEREAEILMAPMEYLEYSDLVKTLPLPTNMNIVATENPKGFFIVIFDAKLIFSVLETIFGGSEISAQRVEGREFTKIEVKVIKKLIDIVCTEMEKAWNPVFQMTCAYSRSEMNPNYVTMVAPEEIINLTEFSIAVENMNSWMKVCVPWALLEPIKGYLISTPSERRSRDEGEMDETVEGKDHGNTSQRQGCPGTKEVFSSGIQDAQRGSGVHGGQAHGRSSFRGDRRERKGPWQDRGLQGE